MFNLKKLIESVFLNSRQFSRRMYTMGLIVFSGAIAVAVVMIGVNGFAGTNHVTGQVVYEAEEDEALAVTQEIEVSEENTDEISQNTVVEPKLDALVATQEQILEEETTSPKLQQAAIEEKNLRSSGNLVEGTVTLLNVRDYTALVKIVEAEATGEDLMGKVLIANVVMNRVKSSGFPDNIYDVVHETIGGKAQFSPISDGRYYSISVTQSTVEAVELALGGTDYSQGALFFVAKSLASDHAVSWFDDHLTYVLTHGVHTFYKY